MIIAPGDSIVQTFVTLDGVGVPTAPSSGPTAVVYKNGVVDGTTSTTIASISTGHYRITLTPSAATYAEGDYIAIAVTATVDSIAKNVFLFNERLTQSVVAIEELCDQIADDQSTENALLTSVEAKTSATNTAVQTSGVLLNSTAIAAVETAIETDPQFQLLMALTGVSGGTRTSYAGGIATYVANKPGGGTVTIVHNENTGSWTVS